MVLIECVGLICGWILTRDTPSLNTVLDEKVKVPGSDSEQSRWIIDAKAENGNTQLSSSNATVSTPIAVATSAVVSVDNLINQSQIVEERIVATPANAPWPYGEIDQYRRYFSTRYTQYKLRSVTFILEPTDSIQNLEGRWTMAFTPMAANQPFTRYFSPKTQANTDTNVIPLPTSAGMLNCPMVKTGARAKSLRLHYRPTGYWADWQSLGWDSQSRADKSWVDVINAKSWDWAVAGLGSRPFGVLDISREDAVTPAALSPSDDGRFNTARVRTIARVELRGMEVGSWQSYGNLDKSCSRRVMRGYWVTSMPGAFDKLRVFPATEKSPALLFRLNSEVTEELSLSQMEIHSPQSMGDD